MVVSTETPIPGGSGSFTDFGGLALDGERVVLQGSGDWVGSAQQQGVYLWSGGALATIADGNTRIAGAAGRRLVSFSPELSASGGMVAFQGSSGFSQDGVYLHDGASITVIADSRGSAGTRFTSFGMLSLEGRNVAFIGTDHSYSVGLYVGDGSSLRAVHSEGTSVPGGTESFLSFEAVSQHSSHVTFIGVGSTGIYTDLGGSLSEVITVGATLDGKTVSSISLGREAFHSDGIAFRAEFEDGTSGIFVAQPTS